MRKEIHGHICGPRLYEYKGWFFEHHSYCGPWPLRKDGELFKRAGDKFWDMIKEFEALSNREEHRVGGGCISF